MNQTKTLSPGAPIVALFLCLLILPGFQCDKGVNDDCKGAYTQKTVAAPISLAVNQNTFAVGDTVRFSSVFNNTLQSPDGSETFTFSSVSNASVQVEVFAVIPPPANGTLPTLQPVFADFNPLIFDGLVEANVPLYYRYRQSGNNNFLSFGLQGRVRGTYIIRFKPFSNGLGGYQDYPCTSFTWTGKFVGNQNTSIFTTYNTTLLQGQSNYTGITPVNINDKNFVVITIN